MQARDPLPHSPNQSPRTTSAKSLESARSKPSLLTGTAARWSQIARKTIVPVITLALVVVTFVVDTITDYEIAGATFYVVVVLLSARFSGRRGVLAISAACFVLTLSSYALTADGNYQTGIINTSISLLAIAATTYLAIQGQAANARAEQAQAHLAHVARITTLGELAASIAHEVNQPLSGIVTNANACTRWIRMAPPNLERAIASTESIVEDANRASEIIARIRALTSPTVSARSRTDINEIIQQVLSLLQTQLRENRISVRTSLSNDLPVIFADQVQLQQVLINLVVNAIDAINIGASDEREIRITSISERGRDVAVTVSDTGVGIAQVIAPHVFDAFHSTKSNGMGIGLSICRSIIEAHGGRIMVISSDTSGASFKFTVPGDSAS